MNEARPAVRIDTEALNDVTVLATEGLLDSSTYRHIRDTVIKAALDEPDAVIVDVNRLRVPAASAWAVFTSARWHVSVWPDVPILLVCEAPQARREIAAAGVARYVPVRATRKLALDALRSPPPPLRRRARTQLPRSRASLGIARRAITEWLTEWDSSELIPAAATVATVFVENVLDHTESAPVLIVESRQGSVTVAVEDCSDRLPGRHEDAWRGAEIMSGLAIVAALSRVWGSTPTSSGKTVWALIGRENRL
ncbi:sulfate transporter [Mycobacterium saskatchewanense]|uniref:Sulfate transporter n=1 Tax=Mycobacterium saskatchewanense TaxID=220927 RepID=A0AAJ3TXT4_9MYCO|nr:STAS domain-containing protein [Mycobacterium saskatchewanense]ORW73253.1 sulfate transporter [Mycobacterium saskatchewanense]BBX65856.1 sulfate transporter [Mycobacterium saskatchewanense]